MADASGGPQDTKLRILVAEDEEAVREFVVRALQSQGYEVTAVVDGSEALRELRKDEFDVLVSDIVMPEIDGISLALMAGKESPDMPIVLMTGYADQQKRAHNLEALVHVVIAKPFGLNEIADAVRGALSLSAD